jgi:hypothetical protein
MGPPHCHFGPFFHCHRHAKTDGVAKPCGAGWNPAADWQSAFPTDQELGVSAVCGVYCGPGEIRTHDLFHAMVTKSIAYRRIRDFSKSYGHAIWTSFGPHALSRGGLDLRRSTPWPTMVAAMPLRSRHRVPHVLRARARLSPSCQFFVQDEEKGLPILQRPCGHQKPCRACGSSSAQSPDNRLWVTLDDGQVGTDGDLRAPAALLPVLKRPHVEAEEGGEVRLR